MWIFNPAVARPRTRGESWGLETSKELQPREGWLARLWEEARKNRIEGCWAAQGRISGGAVGGESRSSPSIHPCLPLLLHSTVVWVTHKFITHHQSPSLHPHSIPCNNLSIPPSGTKAACKMGRAGTRLWVSEEYCGEGLYLPLAILLQ